MIISPKTKKRVNKTQEKNIKKCKDFMIFLPQIKLTINNNF
jgi:hypothetical protein